MNTFDTYSLALDRAGIDQPVLVLDKARLDANLTHIAAHLPTDCNLRIADKSLAAPKLLTHVQSALGARDLMSFDPGLTRHSMELLPQANILMGKPLPARLAANFLMTRSQDDLTRVTWMVDRPSLLQDFDELAQAMGFPLPVCLEVDTGLGRGGFTDPAVMSAAIKTTQALNIKGIMGYEAHVGALPRFLGQGAKLRDRAEARLRSFLAALPETSREIINTGGSGTLLNLGTTSANDVTLGSLAIKPTDFDQPWNADILPAMFVATPVLRQTLHGLPGHPRMSAFLRGLGIIRPRVSLVYGGKWPATIAWPNGLKASPFFGGSSNQQGFAHGKNMSHTRVYLRPDQSDAVIQNVGTIAVVDGSQVVDIWSAFPPGAASPYRLPEF